MGWRQAPTWAGPR
ncbi:unnamed protein product, partial [Cuscuta europaea]